LIDLVHWNSSEVSKVISESLIFVFLADNKAGRCEHITPFL